MSVHRLIRNSLGLAARCVLLFFLIFVAGCTASVELFTDVPETEVNELVSALANAGIGAVKHPGKEGLASITVSQRDLGKAIATLNAEGLPRDRFAKMGDVFRKEGLISSPLEERARYLWALSQELSATISEIDGVLKARVHVVLPERSTGSDPAIPSSAAVFLKYRQQYNMEEASAQIKRLVANSIPGLSQEKVTVVLLPGHSFSGKLEKKTAASDEMILSYPVPAESATFLRFILSGMLFATVFSIAIVGFFAWKRWGKTLKIFVAKTVSKKLIRLRDSDSSA